MSRLGLLYSGAMSEKEPGDKAGEPGAAAARLNPRTHQLVVSLIVACAMFLQSLDCQAIAHAGQGAGVPESNR
jgi:hypothetical protein